MKYASVCSGIEGASVAWGPLGWQPVFFSEIEPFPSAVLAHRYPDVPNLGDMTRYREWPDVAIDVLVGGTPCQSFSVAGLRAGLDDPRGNLTLTYLGVLDRFRPRWMVWENVPGILSDGGNAFGQFLAGLSELGYGYAYRVLDAQYFGVAQRRRRVFVVGYLGDWRAPTAVLFEPESLRWHPAPRRETGEGTPASVAKSLRGRSNSAHREDADNYVANAVGTKWHSGPEDQRDNVVIAHALSADGFDASEDGTGRGTPLVPTLTGNGDAHSGFRDEHGLVSETLRGHPRPGSNTPGVIAIQEIGKRQSGTPQNGVGHSAPGDPMFTLQSTAQHGIANHTSVRRLTPRECERLQGLPDDYTLVPYNGKPAKDGPRYKAIGNGFATPVVRWIGERIALCDPIARTYLPGA